MSKETEELVVILVVGFLFLKLLSGSSATSLALAQSKINSATDLGYAGDATTVIGDFADMWS
jgi:hypothetical protein